MRSTEPADWLKTQDMKLNVYSTEPGHMWDARTDIEPLRPWLFFLHVSADW